MALNRSIRANIGAGSASGACVVALIVVLGACEGLPPEIDQAAVGVMAAAAPSLQADLPAAIRPAAIASSAQASLEARGYTIRRRRVTNDSARIEAGLGGSGRLSRVIVTARPTQTGSRVSIKITPTGDESRARRIMDEILRRLGL